MKTIVNTNKSQYQFKLGDFFTKKDYTDTLLLAINRNGYHLISLETGAASFVCKDSDMIQLYLKNKVESNSLMYYSQEDYWLEPHEKENLKEPTKPSDTSLNSGDLFEAISDSGKKQLYMLCSFDGLFALTSLNNPGQLYYSGFATFEPIEVAIKNDILLNNLTYYRPEDYDLKLTNIAI